VTFPEDGGTKISRNVKHYSLKDTASHSIILKHFLSLDFISFNFFIKRTWCRSRWPRGLRFNYAAVRLLGLRVRISQEACISFCCECCVVSGRVWVYAKGRSLFQMSPTEREREREKEWERESVCVCVCVCVSVIRCNENTRHLQWVFFLDVLLTVHPSIILVINEPNAQNSCFISLYAPICFEHCCAHHREVKIVFYSIWYRPDGHLQTVTIPAAE